MKRIIFILLFLSFSTSAFAANVHFDFPRNGSISFSNSHGYMHMYYRVLRPQRFFVKLGDFQTRIQNSDGTWGPWITGRTGVWEKTKARSYKFQARVWVKWDFRVKGNYWIYSSIQKLFFEDNYAPSAPQSISSTSSNNHPKITWSTNTEADINNYDVYKNNTYLATTSNNYYVDESERRYVPGDGDKSFVYYKVKAKDINGNSSNYSSREKIVINYGPSPRANKIAVDEKSNDVTSTYKLYSNYPNPFNPSTKISYQILKDGFVNLVVYNTLGQEVAQLVNQRQSSGKYSVEFNATNLPSGVYIYKLQAGEFNATKKMLLAK